MKNIPAGKHLHFEHLFEWQQTDVYGVSVTSGEYVMFKFIVNQLSSDPEEVTQFAIHNYEGWSDNKFICYITLQLKNLYRLLLHWGISSWQVSPVYSAEKESWPSQI
jgi:hypothetical protein